MTKKEYWIVEPCRGAPVEMQAAMSLDGRKQIFVPACWATGGNATIAFMNMCWDGNVETMRLSENSDVLFAQIEWVEREIANGDSDLAKETRAVLGKVRAYFLNNNPPDKTPTGK